MGKKVVISKRGLTQRIDRALRPGKRLRAARGKQVAELGAYFIASRTGVTQKHVDLAKIAQELGVLHEWEAIEK
jgi:hypothetical protein